MASRAVVLLLLIGSWLLLVLYLGLLCNVLVLYIYLLVSFLVFYFHLAEEERELIDLL